MRRFGKLNFSQKLALGITALSILGLTIIYLVVSAVVFNITYARVVDTVQRDIIIQAHEIDAWFGRYSRLVEHMATTWMVVGVEPGETGFGPDPIGARFLEESDSLVGIFVGFENGWHVNSSGWIPPPGFHAPDRPWYIVPKAAGGEIAITLPYARLLDGDIVASMGKWVPSMLGMEAVVAVDIRLVYILGKVAGYLFEGGGYLILAGPNGEIIAHPNPAYMLAPDREAGNLHDIYDSHLLIDGIVDKLSITNFNCPTLGSAYFMTVPLSAVNWTLFAVFPNEAILGPVRQNMLIIMPVIILFVLISSATTLFFVSYISRREQRTNEMNEILLGASPFIMNIWDNSFTLVSTSKQSVEMFGLSSQQQYIERFNDLSPEHQPCGTPSNEKNLDYVKKAFHEGQAKFEWMHQTLDGEPVPSEITLVRFKRNDKYAVAAYTVDLRPVKRETQKLLDEMRRREIAEEETLAKSKFLARMSHEIRTPMHTVLGITKIQLQKEDLSPETEEAFLRIEQSSNILLRIINDVLDLSKVEAGKMEIVNDTYELANMLADTVQLNIMRIGNKKIEFKLNLDERLPSCLIGDELRIKQILSNLLSNAFKYTEEGFVTVSVGTEPLDTADAQGSDCVTLVLRVQDTGHGMTKEQLVSLFGNEYQRFNLKYNKAIEGIGLGMIITHELISMMGGNVQVESKIDQGSTFTVRLPQKLAGNTEIDKETAENLQNFNIALKSLQKAPKVEHTPMPYGRVLAVDDVESNLHVIRGILEPYKITVETVNSGQEAVGKIRDGNVYDIIFMDHMMPDMDGIEATRIIRESGYTHPIVALTANTIKGISQKFLRNGFSGFISKPIDFNKFDSFLVRYIRDKQPPEVLEAAEKLILPEQGSMKAKKKTIFLVDDSTTNLMTGKNLLSQTYNVYTCNSGARMFNLLGKIMPDLVLLDIEMPEMDGYEVIARLKHDENTANIPVVLLTAHSDAETEIKGRSLGARDLITKPFSPAALLKSIETHILKDEATA